MLLRLARDFLVIGRVLCSRSTAAARAASARAAATIGLPLGFAAPATAAAVALRVGLHFLQAPMLLQVTLHVLEG
jgi:hypothetical protein